MPRFTLRMCTCVIYGVVLPHDIREISWRILSACELVPLFWLCPGTGWLLPPCLANQAPLQQISLLPIPVNAMSPDLQAARGVWVCVHHMCVCSWLHRRWGRREEERILKRLEVYWLPFAVPPLPSLGLRFSVSLFIGACRGQCIWLFSTLQTSSELPSLKTFQRFIECTSAIIMEGEHEGN